MADPQRLRPPRPPRLPGSRAVVGGLLVALAVGLSLQSMDAGESGPTTRYLIAVDDLDVGDELEPDDVRSVAVELPSTQAARAIPGSDEISGAVALGPIREGQLLAVSDVLRADEATGSTPVRELSLPVPVERALDGRLVPGEIVDVLATEGTGGEASTNRVADDVRVLSVSSPDDSLARAGIVVLTLAVADDDTALALAHAGATAELSIVRGVTR